MSDSHRARHSVSEQLVGFALKRSRSASADVRRAAARSLFDFCGCVFGARASPLEWSHDRAGWTALRAHVRDQDDLHLPSLTHPGGVIWSAVTACGLERDATWGESAEAAVLGYEVMVRLGEALNAEHRKHWHATAVAGVVGAAAAAGRLLGCSEQALMDAVGHATSITSGSAQAQVERTGTLLVHRAFAASMGVACARAASVGVEGNRWGLDEGRGAFAAGPLVIRDSVLKGREPTALEETGFRLHPATGFAHSAIDAALMIGSVAAEAVDNVSVVVSPPAAVALASHTKPASDEDAWWSIEHAVATCLVTGTTDALASGLTRDEHVLRLCRLTSVSAVDAGWCATVEVTTTDGQVRRASVPTPWGHGDRAASDADLSVKWSRLTGGDGSHFLDTLLSASSEAKLAKLLEPDFAAERLEG